LSKKVKQHNQVYRLIDANVNRAKEGLRVLEDILRFICDDKRLARKTKDIRHEISAIIKKKPQIKPLSLLKHRKISSDVGRGSNPSEVKRADTTEIFLANAQRVKESIRVLEEFSKLISINSAEEFKKLRYEVYFMEKSALAKISKICNNKCSSKSLKYFK